jgi:biotin carboxyl carrier protein
VTEEDVISMSSGSATATSVVSPMPGRIVKCFVQPGEAVKKGQNLVSVESMKMEYFVKATADGVVDLVKCSEGDAVQLKQKLVTFKAPAE